MNEALLRASGLSRTLPDGTTLFRDVSLELFAGRCAVLLGRSGSGKSSLLHVLGTLERQYRGTLHILGQAVEGLSDSQAARLRHQNLGFVFQHFNLVKGVDVLRNVTLPERLFGEKPDVARARAVLDTLGLGAKLQARVATLSGGERQRVAVARALVRAPKLLLADEPTGNLDAETTKLLLSALASLRARGTALLIATHDKEVAAFADEVFQIAEGNVSA